MRQDGGTGGCGDCGAQHRRRIDRRAREESGIDLALFGHSEDLGHRPRRRVRLEALDSARREDEHAMGAFATHALLPREGHHVEVGPRHVHRKHGRGRIADGEAGTVGRRRERRRHAHARGGAVVLPRGSLRTEGVSARSRSGLDRVIARREERVRPALQK